jgi:hypothetical protein
MVAELRNGRDYAELVKRHDRARKSVRAVLDSHGLAALKGALFHQIVSLVAQGPPDKETRARFEQLNADQYAKYERLAELADEIVRTYRAGPNWVPAPLKELEKLGANAREMMTIIGDPRPKRARPATELGVASVYLYRALASYAGADKWKHSRVIADILRAAKWSVTDAGKLQRSIYDRLKRIS